MDPIKSLISGSDPLRHDPAAVPDAEVAVRRVLNDAPMFSDSLSANVLRFEDRKRRRARMAGVLTLAAVAVTAGVLVATNLGPLVSAPEPARTVVPSPVESTVPATPTPTVTPSATRAATATPTPTPTPTPPAAALTWTTFTDATGQATFEHPLGWTMSEAPKTIEGAPYNVVELKDAAGKAKATLRLLYDSAGGPACPDPKPYRTLDSVVVDIPQRVAKRSGQGPSAFVFRIIEGDKVYGSLALADEDLAPAPTTCGLHNGIIGPENVPIPQFGDTEWLMADGKDAPLTFDSVAEAKAYMGTQEYQDMKRMLISLSLTPTFTRFSFDGGKSSFNLPLGWTARNVAAGNADFPATGVDVFDESNKRVASLLIGGAGGLGGACTEKYPVTELDTGPSSLNEQWAMSAQVRFSYRVLDRTAAGQGLSYQVGLVDKDSGTLQDSCLMYTVVSGEPRGMLTFADNAVQDAAEPRFASMAEARAYLETPEYKKLKAMIQSLQITS
ncbi:hypothetical protein [Arthrobacter sp. ZGTC131]|uniref:hypothetical protein n=1 Tax=Arthrobacter sp. ZGTC131 TaxID=2058898 RepID=UPI0015E39062|nr:hypothetical protein [Arthrobacter sp. ZGTC131]